MFDKLVGQNKAKNVIEVLVGGAKKQNKTVPHILLSGPAGTGKTSFARTCASVIGSHFFCVNAASSDMKSLNIIINNLREKDILFIDEIHALSKKVSESLYTIVEDYCYFNNAGAKVDVEKFTLIGATTELGKIPKPLHDRFNFIAEFEEYSLDELAEISKSVFKEDGLNLSINLARIIAKTCRGIPRIVKQRSSYIKSYMLTRDVKKMTNQEVLDIIQLSGYNEHGLSSKDIAYLNLLLSGDLSLNALASKLSLDTSTVTEMEKYLMKCGYVEVNKTGRSITDLGVKIINGKRQHFIGF